MFKSVSYFFCSQISLKSVFVFLFFSHWVTDLGLVSTSIILLIFPKLSVTPVVTCPTFPRTIPSNAYCSDVVIHTIPFTLKSVPVYAVNYIVTLSMTYMMGKHVVTLLTLSFLIFSSISHCWLFFLWPRTLQLVLLTLVFFGTLSWYLCSSHFTHIFRNHISVSYFAFCIYFSSNAVNLSWKFNTNWIF